MNKYDRNQMLSCCNSSCYQNSNNKKSSNSVWCLGLQVKCLQLTAVNCSTPFHFSINHPVLTSFTPSKRRWKHPLLLCIINVTLPAIKFKITSLVNTFYYHLWRYLFTPQPLSWQITTTTIGRRPWWSPTTMWLHSNHKDVLNHFDPLPSLPNCSTWSTSTKNSKKSS